MIESRWHEITSGQARGFGPALARFGLRLGSGLYAAGLAGNHALYDLRIFKLRQPALPVVSIGNLTLGGTGKTTVTRFLARRMTAAGLRPGIVLRGYRRRTGPAALLVSAGADALVGVDTAGDEAVMLARTTANCAVAVGKHREQVVDLLAAQTNTNTVLLDDGLQYFRLAKAADVILLDATVDLAHARLFPSGVLREPLATLARASQIWLTHCDLAPPGQVDRTREIAERYAPGVPIVLTRHALTGMREIGTGREAPLSEVEGQEIIALSGLGNPVSFEDSLRVLKPSRIYPARFSDHHAYSGSDWRHIGQQVMASHATMILTTEKDDVKLAPPPTGIPTTVIVTCDVEVLEGEAHVKALVEEACFRSVSLA
jgi:tetraacyldisaccharide 4'-kinase